MMQFISYDQFPQASGPTTFVTWAEKSQYGKVEDLIGRTVLINGQPMAVEAIRRFPEAEKSKWVEMIGLIAHPAVGGDTKLQDSLSQATDGGKK